MAKKVLVYSGRTEDDSAPPPSVVEVFDPLSETWEEKQSTGDLPAQGLREAASASSKGDFFTYGGKDGDDNLVDSLHQLSAETYQWCRLPSGGEPPMPKYLAAMAACGDGLALLGGFGAPCDSIKFPYGRVWTNEFHIYHFNEGILACTTINRICDIISCLAACMYLHNVLVELKRNMCNTGIDDFL